MYLYVYVYVYLYVYVHTHVHVYVFWYIYIYMHVHKTTHTHQYGRVIRRFEHGQHLVVWALKAYGRIPVKSSHPYVGLIISYHDYSDASIRHRIQQG